MSFQSTFPIVGYYRYFVFSAGVIGKNMKLLLKQLAKIPTKSLA